MASATQVRVTGGNVAKLRWFQRAYIVPVSRTKIVNTAFALGFSILLRKSTRFLTNKPKKP